MKDGKKKAVSIDVSNDLPDITDSSTIKKKSK